MIKLIAFIVITSIAIILGPMLADSQGFVHIATNTHIVETSLTTAIVLYLASIILLFIIYAVVKKIISIPSAGQSISGNCLKICDFYL